VHSPPAAAALFSNDGCQEKRVWTLPPPRVATGYCLRFAARSHDISASTHGSGTNSASVIDFTHLLLPHDGLLTPGPASRATRYFKRDLTPLSNHTYSIPNSSQPNPIQLSAFAYASTYHFPTRTDRAVATLQATYIHGGSGNAPGHVSRSASSHLARLSFHVHVPYGARGRPLTRESPLPNSSARCLRTVPGFR
jgi:hypothetical protein